jgi:AcrR family transcriptional regulator
LSPKLGNTKALQIIASAKQEFAERGFYGARVARIARLAGVNKQLLFYYFHSKRGLFRAVLRHAVADLEKALATVDPGPGRPLERLRAMLAGQFAVLADRPDLVTLLSHAERSDAAPFAPAIRRLVVLLAEGQGTGQVRDDADPHIVAAQAVVLMVAYLRLESLIAVSAPPLGADEPALRERWARAAVDLVVHGVGAG